MGLNERCSTGCRASPGGIGRGRPVRPRSDLIGEATITDNHRRQQDRRLHGRWSFKPPCNHGSSRETVLPSRTVKAMAAALRLNGEIKRLGIFPNEDALTRLIGALLLEENDEWAVQRGRYMSLKRSRL
jgi:hypothetical protein